MRYDKISKETYFSLDGTDLVLHLSSTGWKRTDTTNNYYTYRVELDNSWEEIIVPRRRDFSDYSELMQRAVQTISKVECKSEVDVFMDINLKNYASSIQHRIDTKDNTGTISFEMFKSTLEAYKNISYASYMDLKNYKIYHKNRRSASHALDNMRVGQTSFGSYVVRIIYPFSQTSDTSQTKLDGNVNGDLIIQKLAAKIIDSSSTIIESAIDDVIDINAEKFKISYNFVESFLQFGSDPEVNIEMKLVDYGIGDKNLTKGVSFKNTLFPRIENIAESLKPSSEKEKMRFTGRIYTGWNVGNDDDDPSRFRIEYFKEEGGTGKATFMLDGNDRTIAMDAFRDRKLVSMEGFLVGYGNKRKIEEPCHIKIIGP